MSGTISASLAVLLCAASACQALVIDHACTDLSQVPEYWIEQARSTFKMTYGHTSHGSQVVTGMETLRDSIPGLWFINDQAYYAWQSGSPAPDTVLSLWDYVPEGDLGNPDWVTWAGRTDTMLLNLDGSYQIYPHGRNLVMWSWCGQVSWADSATIATYLSLMGQLELSHPNVTFIHMTSHLDGTGAGGNLNVRNQQIRAYCLANDKVLFDFADIESYDPDGLVDYMELYANDNCDYDSSGTLVNWAQSWINRNPGHELARLSNACGSCAHSQQLNCILKSRAFWWMMARLAGWDGSTGAEGERRASPQFQNFRTWPNPIRSLAELRFSRPGHYRIYNALGQLIAKCDGKAPIHAKGRAGVYFVRQQGADACRRVTVVY